MHKLTDKVEMDVEAAVEGKLGEIIVPAGKTVPVGTVLAYLEDVSEDAAVEAREQLPAEMPETISAPRQSPVPPQSESGRVDSPKNPPERQRGVSPRAKRLAKELGVDVATIRGTGVDGQVTEKDIRSAATGRSNA